MTDLKVRKIGSSLGVILPKECLSRLRVAEGDTLHLSEAPDGGYRLTPYDPSFADKLDKAQDIMGRYRNSLRILSK